MFLQPSRPGPAQEGQRGRGAGSSISFIHFPTLLPSIHPSDTEIQVSGAPLGTAEIKIFKIHSVLSWSPRAADP